MGEQENDIHMHRFDYQITAVMRKALISWATQIYKGRNKDTFEPAKCIERTSLDKRPASESEVFKIVHICQNW